MEDIDVHGLKLPEESFVNPLSIKLNSYPPWIEEKIRMKVK
ncbi:hypothetical protein KP78_16820 [Jeotgalibacillus soli]|uniref:Uncharacterized protein n=1 Tax=Jeotgalibacillus soli TaxID=889306 RepID=A0A0C2RD76_9BACL|nr:hypothetical protein KP78_16820 [Jeotgalibacillus soli]